MRQLEASALLRDLRRACARVADVPRPRRVDVGDASVREAVVEHCCAVASVVARGEARLAEDGDLGGHLGDVEVAKA